VWLLREKEVPMQQYPEPTVGAMILDPQGKLFLMRSHKWRDQYVIPGGHIEVGESIEQALRREIKEETGLDIDHIEFIGFQEFILDDAFWEKRHFIFFDYACTTESIQVTLNDEAQEYAWVPLAEALNWPIEPYTRSTIQRYIRQHAER
jgi:nucleoside triphosphatase